MSNRRNRKATIDDQFWRHHALLYWIYLVAESKTGVGLPAGSKRITAKRWEKMPAEVRSSVTDADTKQRILDAADRGSCWFCKMEDVGWRAGKRQGAKQVGVVQTALEWINAFRDRGTVQGNKLLWASVDSKVE